MNSSLLLRRVGMGLGVVAVVALLAVGSSQLDKMLTLLEWVQGAGPVGWVAFGVVYLAATVVMAPASWLQGSAGFLLGPVGGFLAASACSTAAGTVNFLLARTVLRDVVKRRAERDPTFHAVDAAIGDGGAYLVGLLRLSPISPFNVVSYALGLTRVRTRDYVLGTWLGSAPAVLMYSYIGSTVSSLAELLEGGSARDMAPQVLILVTTVIATALVARFAQTRLRDALKAVPG